MNTITKKGKNMAMIYCRECGYKHSDRADACPKCGYRAFNAEKSIAIYLVLLWLFGVFGAHKFYAGRNGQGIAMLMLFLFGLLTYPFAFAIIAAQADLLGASLLFIGLAALIGVCVWVFVDFIVTLCNLRHPEKIFIKKK